LHDPGSTLSVLRPSCGLIHLGPLRSASLLQALIAGTASHIDPSVRKTCVQILQQLVVAWLPGSQEAFPGVRRWVLDKVAGEAILRGVLQSGLDLQVPPFPPAPPSHPSLFIRLLLLSLFLCGGILLSFFRTSAFSVSYQACDDGFTDVIFL
jgi:hypothetical protein